jgi:2-polyprenyl-6-methoxyphenol hydroxylase-like FAD-dependent oxidoreductase
MRAVIVGAGIGGLTAGIALRQAGIDVLVLEQAPELHEVGAGISLWPNAINTLRRLGVGPAVEALGLRVADTDIQTWRGRSLHRSSSDLIEDRFGAPLTMIRRSDLHAALRQALGDEILRLGTRCVSIDAHEDGVRVQLADGNTEHCAVLIGADGLRSVVRTVTVGDGPPRHSGMTAWRAVVSLDRQVAARVTVGEFWGHGSLFGVQSLGGDSFYWYAASRVGEPDLEPEIEKEALLRRFDSWVAPIAELINATDAQAILCNDLYDRRVPDSLAFGRVALVGDAAHPMLPTLGQGACQAIVDGEALAVALTEASDPVAGLRLYSERRRQTAALAVSQSRQMSKVALASNPVVVGLRNTLLSRASQKSSLKRLAPILVEGQRATAHDAALGDRP